MAISWDSILHRSPRCRRGRQTVVVRHALHPALVISSVLLIVACVAFYSTGELGPRVFIQYASLAVALYALYRTTGFYGKVTVGMIAVTRPKGDDCAEDEVLSYRSFVITNSFKSSVYVQMQGATSSQNTVGLDLTGYPSGIMMEPSSVRQMKPLAAIPAGVGQPTVSVDIMVLLSSGRKIEKPIILST